MTSPQLLMLLAQARQDDLRRTAAAHNRHQRPAQTQRRIALERRVTLRMGSQVDESPVRRLAALASAKTPGGPGLLAEVDGQLRAALSLRDDTVVVHPSHRTAGVTELLRARADQLDGSVQPRRWRHFRREPDRCWS